MMDDELIRVDFKFRGRNLPNTDTNGCRQNKLSIDIAIPPRTENTMPVKIVLRLAMRVEAVEGDEQK